MAVKITVPVEFKDSAQSYKQIIIQLENQLKKVKPGSAIYKNIEEQLKKAKKFSESLDLNLDKSIGSTSDIDRIEKSFSSLWHVIENINQSFRELAVTDLNIIPENFGENAKQLTTAMQELTDAKKALTEQKGKKVSNLITPEDAKLFNSDQLDLTAEELLTQLKSDLPAIQAEFSKTTKEVEKLKRELEDLERKNAEASAQIVPFASEAMSIVSNNKGLEKSRAKAIELFKQNFSSVDGNEEAIKSWLTLIGLDESSISQLFSEANINIERISNFISEKFSQANQDFIRANYFEVDQTNKALKSTISDRNKRISAKKDAIGEATGRQTEYKRQVDSLERQTEVISAQVSTKEITDLENKIATIQQRISEIQQQLLAQKPTGVNTPQIPNRKIADENLQAANEAKRFQENLKDSISHWLSAQMIITKVREGIHQAWTDIQGLDKAMTNIAVVTDMSVSDLWGKINDYMAIAQEYGVTTQGVYEVSQLYYQQGLSTNEVMKATTETLKMARIAGMDYAEAADAMTVAIRAFKMEMSDAQVITDVYSKVAAVTASDSEELAIAMSKTASSAESVGSSFENTTAMLAVMIETTRESAQNLGSALKSIISRYGEMKVGLTVDSEGEEIDYNKVDTALQSVGISIKDAQGQFRDFDEVIFELSKKWDSLDKNTQRYIATIMAGNRQQSRFIALVDNWERLEEVSAAAYDSQDAGLLQYAKTLDSLETKLNALSTSFQQFYMSIVNGDTFKGIIDMITNFINGLNQLGSWPAILNVGLLLKSLKTVASTFVNSFSSPLSGIINQYKSTFSQITSLAFSEGVKAGQNHAKGVEVGISSSSTQSGVTGTTKRRIQGIKTGTDRKFIRKKGFELRQQQQQDDPFGLTNKQAKFAKGASIVGPLLTMLGTSVANKHAGWGATISGFGNVASGIAAGSGFGVAGMAIGGVLAGIASLPAIMEGFNPDKILAQKIQQAEEALNEAEITRATKKEEARNLQSTIENLRKLQKARYSSEEAEKAFIEASNTAFEQFPQLTATFDETGNAIIDVISETSNAEQLLIEARKAAADAAEEAAAAELKLNIEKQKQAQEEYDKYYKNNTKVDTFARNLGQQYGYLNFNGDSYKGKNVLEIADGYFAAIDSYLKDYETELRDFWGYSEEQITNEIARERELLEGSFFTQLSGSGIGITLDEEDLTLRGLKTSASQAQQKLNSTTGATNASREASINRTIDNLLLDIDPNQTGEWLEIEGITSTFYERVKDVIGDPESAFDPVTKELLPNVKDTIYNALETYTSAWNEISGYLTTSYQKEDFNELLTAGKKGSITFSEFQEQYRKLFEEASLSENAQTELNEASKEIEANNRKAIGQLALTLNDDHGFKWDKHGVLLEKLKNIPQQYFANLYDFSETIDAQLEEGLINESQAKDLTSRYLQMWEGLGAAGLDSETLGQARNALASANLFSIDGINTLTTTLKDLGVETENLPGLKDFPVYAVNFTTEYATLIEKMNKGMESLRELLSNLADGLETEDAEKLAKKMGTTLSDSSAFEFIDGKWYVKNIETAIAAIEKTYSSLQAQLKTTLDDSVGKLSGTVDTSDEEIKQLVSINEESAKKWAAEQAAKGITNLPDFDTDGGRSLVAAYLQAEYEGITQAYETEKAWLIAETERSLAIGQRARELAGGEEKKRQRESYDLIKGNGLLGYSAEEAAQLEKDLGLSFEQNADGTFDLKKSDIAKLPLDVRNAVYQWIDDEAQSVLDAISSLGETSASGKDTGAYAKAFSNYTDKWGYNLTETTIKSWLEGASLGGKEAEQSLKEAIAAELAATEGVEKIDISDPRVQQTYNELIAGYKDSISENTLRYLELYEKVVDGTITEKEKIELNLLKEKCDQWVIDLTTTLGEGGADSLKNLSSIISKAIANNVNWEEIEAYVETEASSLLKVERLKAAGLSSLIDDNTSIDIINLFDSILEADGAYSENLYTDLQEQAQKLGKDFSQERFLQAFRWDDAAGGFVAKSAEAVEQLFESWGIDIPAVFARSGEEYNLNEAIRIDDFERSLTDTFTGLYSKPIEASLDDVRSLYESIYGEGSFTKNANHYIDSINKAQQGYGTQLQKDLILLLEEARAKDINIDYAEINRTLADIALESYAKVASALAAGVEGTLTNTDFHTLLTDLKVQQIDEAGNLTKEWLQWQSSVIETNEGLKFTQTGLINVYNLLSKIDAIKGLAFLESNIDNFKGYETLIDTTNRIRELREQIAEVDEKTSPDRKKQYEAELKVAKQIYRIRSQDPEQFNFMDISAPDNIQAAINTWQSALDAAEVLAESRKTGYMEYSDFNSMLTTIGNNWVGDAENFLGTSMTYAELMRKAGSALEGVEGEVSVNLSKLGIGIEGGLDNLAGGFEDGLKEVAKEQIKLIDGLIAMLTMMDALDFEDLFGGDGIQTWDEAFEFDGEKIVGFTEDFTKAIGVIQGFVGELYLLNEAGQEIDIFQGIAEGLVNPQDAVRFINDVIAQVKAAIESGHPEQLATLIPSLISKYFGEGIQYRETTSIFGQIELVDAATGTYSYKGQTGTAEDIYKLAAEDILKDAEKASEKAEAILNNGETKFDSTITSGGTVEVVNDTTIVDDKTGIPIQRNYILDETANIFVNGEDSGYTNIVDYLANKDINEQTEPVLIPVNVAFDYKTNFANGVTIDGVVYNSIVAYISSIIASAKSDEIAPVQVPVTVTAETESATSQLETIITKLATIEKAKDRQVSVKASTYSAYNQLQSIITSLSKIVSKSITIHTSYTTSGTPPSDTNSSTTTQPTIQKPNQTTPTVKVKGNVALAKGTLMGELGPELYVQNGSYHIAGSNGPEFVDLADDAIVFNHLQTKRILNTGHSFGRGTPVTNERRAVAWATGNVTGPACASGVEKAIEQLKTARSFWEGILNNLSLSDLMEGSGGHKGGGSGNSIKAVTEELQEWYNLSRQIKDIEQDINNLLAERENIEWSNGEEYLKSLREQQKLLQQQMATQQALLDYQELQLKRQAEHINQNRIWSQFLTVGADGLLQYIEGNETNGGKGALQVLQELNQMSGEQQTAYLKSIGYSYTNNDGKKLEGQELVEQFFQELQDQIDQYDSLYDTVHGTQETLEELQTSINDINDQIKENQMELEEEIFDIIVEALEKEIEVLEEQVDLIEEANEAYINGLNEALSAERQMYDDNQKVADREQLQRQLSLLRRSGGSASEIANLEEQLDDMLKDEYFTNQERMIEDIKKANDLQVQQLQTQIKLQEDSLQYQKEHGVIWTQVYQVLAQSKDEILAFMQGQKPEFFSQSLLQQEAMLTEWAHKIGIYSEDRKYQNFAEHARNNLWDNGQAWNLGDMSKYQSTYNTLTDEEKNTIRDQFTSVYAQARLDGKDHTTAANEAAAAVSQTLKRKQDAGNAEGNTPPTTNPNPTNPGGGSSGGDSGGNSGGSSGGSTSESSPTHYQFYYNGKRYRCFTTKEKAIEKIQALNRSYTTDNPDNLNSSDLMAEVRKRYNNAVASIAKGTHAQGYKHGGLVDYTGPAIVHGTKSRPEAFLNAEQTAQIREGLKESGKGGALEGIKAALLKLDSSIKAVTNISNKTESNSYTIAPGAIVIQVEQLNDAYDVDTLSADIMNRMYAIGNKSTNRGVSRR